MQQNTQVRQLALAVAVTLCVLLVSGTVIESAQARSIDGDTLPSLVLMNDDDQSLVVDKQKVAETSQNKPGVEPVEASSSQKKPEAYKRPVAEAPAVSDKRDDKSDESSLSARKSPIGGAPDVANKAFQYDSSEPPSEQSVADKGVAGDQEPLAAKSAAKAAGDDASGGSAKETDLIESTQASASSLPPAAEPVPAAPAALAVPAASDSTSQDGNQAKGDRSEPESSSSPPQVSSPAAAPTTTTAEKDLKSLLESKDDAENDLNSPTSVAVATSQAAATPSGSDTAKSDSTGASGSELSPQPVAGSGATHFSADKPVDDRFHYTVGGPVESSVPDKKVAVEDKVPASGGDKSELGGKKDVDDEATGESDKTKTDEAPESKPVDKEESGDASDDEEEQGPTTTLSTSAAEPSTTTTTTSTTAEPPKETQSASTTEASQDPDANSAKKELEAAEKQEATVATAAPAPAVSAEPKPAVEVAQEESTKTTGKVDAVASPAKESPQTTTTTTTTSTTSAAPKSEPEKAPEAPAAQAPGSLVASAVAAAAGSALGSALSGKDTKPTVVTGSSQSGSTSPTPPSSMPKAASSPSSTLKPNVGSSSTSTTTTRGPTRKSSTDRWNRWQPTTAPSVWSSSMAPPTRRRPILPPIRRRFRPYNRFSPFPWAGPEPYAPSSYDHLPPFNADAEPDFSLGRPAFGLSPSSSTLRPKRRDSTDWSRKSATSTSTTTTGAPSRGAEDDSDDNQDNSEDEVIPNVSTRRRYGGSSGSGSKRRTQPGSQGKHHRRQGADEQGTNDTQDPLYTPRRDYGYHNRDHHNNHHHHNRHDYDQHNHQRRRHHNNHHHRGRNDDRPSYFESAFGPAARPSLSGSPGFSLFNTPTSGVNGAGGSGPTGSGFDLLNPFSWLDEVTKPRPPLQHRPLPSSGASERPFSPHLGSGGSGPGSHIGAAARPSARPPVPVEGEYNDQHNNEGPLLQPHDSHDSHHHAHRPHRPSVSGVGSNGRDSYDDHHHDHDHHHGHHHHDCDHEHDRDRDQDYDQHHNQHRPHRPSRPSGGNDYDTYTGRRPDRPYNRRDESASGSPSSSAPTGIDRVDPQPSSYSGRETESIGPSESSSSSSSSSSPSSPFRSSTGERHSHEHQRPHSVGGDGISSGTPLLRVPGSVFSPFGSLFGSLDESLFGGLRSSFIDSPLKAAAATVDSVRQAHGAAFDAIVTSPKISLPAPISLSPSTSNSDQQGTGTGGSATDAAKSSRLISIESGEPSAVRKQPAVPALAPTAIVADGPAAQSSGRIVVGEQSLMKSSSGEPSEAPIAAAAVDKQKQVELPPRAEFARGGIRHFLLMI